ncbi:MAG: penicillin acylase family protein [Deltaproteobacteria bacterium]|nr:penicillin acylase family protein [Deltaproteobacteria bacterium]
MRAALAALLLLAACPAPVLHSGAPRPVPPPQPIATGPSYHATVRWTSDGVPHVVAEDWAGLGYGQGWALASLHVCEVADQIVRVRGERAKYFGPGVDDANLDSDFFHRHMGFEDQAPAAIARLSPETAAVGRGFVAGYNRWIATHASSTWPADCKDAPWVTPVTVEDMTANALAIATTASSRALLPLIARAAPRAGGVGRLPLPARSASLASNAWAIGGDRTEDGGGVLVANPHFPWEGELRFYESQLTIPGKLDVYGASLIGVPLINIGFNRDVAWSHTFSSSTHFVLYRLPLVEGTATKVAVGETPSPITPTTYTIDVKGPNGALTRVSRTLYRSHWGPMVDSAELPWDPASATAYAITDVALDSDGDLHDGAALDEYLAFARATSVHDIAAAVKRSHTPFLNTIAADAAGEALYIDGSRVPALTDQGIAMWQLGRKAIPALDAAWKKGVVVLDASNALFNLAGDAHGARLIDGAPRLERRDFVMNANDPFRFTNPSVVMPDASPLYGEAATPSTRTLANWMALLDPKVRDRATAAAAILSNQSSTATLFRAEIVARCKASNGLKTERDHRRGAAVRVIRDLTQACTTLEHWDGRFGVDSRGAALWRELMRELAPGYAVPWKVPYRPGDATTPRGLADRPATGPDPVATALETVMQRFADAKLALDAPLGAVQFTLRNGQRVPLPGGQELDGVANVVTWGQLNGTLLPRQTRGAPLSPSGLTADGWPVNYGTSFVMAVDLDPKAGTHADVLLTYGNSGDPASPHYRDQLGSFAAGALRPARTTDAEIAADPGVTTEDLRYTEAAP